MNEKNAINDAQKPCRFDNAFGTVSYSDELVDVDTVPLDVEKTLLAYILKTKSVPGNIVKAKLEALNIPKKDIGKFMKSGEYTNAEDGKTVYLKDVRDPDVRPQALAILDLPHRESIAMLLKSGFTEKYCV